MACSRLEDIEAFVKDNGLFSAPNLLVQIYSGILEETYIHEIQSEVMRLLPHSVVAGVTTDGEVMNGEISSEKMIISFSVFEHTKVRSGTLLLHEETGCLEPGKEFISDFISPDTKAMILLSSGIYQGIDDLLGEIRTASPEVTVIGGIAGDNGQFKDAMVFDGTRIIRNGLIAIALNSEHLHAYSLANYGWKEMGAPFSISEADGKRVYSIDGMRPAELMRRYLGDAFVNQLPKTGAQFPFVIQRDSQKVYVFITNAFEDGSVEMNRKVSAGEKITFAYAHTPMLIENSINQTNELLNRPVESLFIFNCMARKRYFRSFTERELKLLEQIAPTSGFFSYGEFRIDEEGKNEFLGNSLMMLALSETAEVKREGKAVAGFPVADEDQIFLALSHLIEASSNDIKRLNRSIEVSQEHYESLFKNNSDVVYSTDLKGNFTSINPSFENILGYSEEDILGTNALSYIKKEDVQRVRGHFHRALNGEKQHYNLELPSKSGELFLFQLKNIPIVINGENVGIFGIGRDITDQKRNEEEIARLAFYDGDTGLPNRMKITEILKETLDKKDRAAVMFVDMDRFKIVNDSLGHYAGDEILKQVASRIQKVLPPGSYAGRFSGDKFALILTENIEVDSIIQAGQEILQTIAKPIMYKNQEFFITGSIGVSIYPNDGVNDDALLKNADTAMNRSKLQGGNRIKFYSTEMNEQALFRLEIESYLRKALQKDEFYLLYQPLLDLNTGRLYGSEALIRWEHPKLGIVPPSEFISLAEETGLIYEIGQWVLKTACRQNKLWHDDGYDDLIISVNVSANQFQAQNFVEEVKEALQETGLAPEFLNLELTESIMLRNINHTVTVMKELKELGVKVSIDDFGTGYSSLSYLKDLPIDGLKIDRSFINNLQIGTSDIAIVKAIITMGHGLSVKVVAEGVETPEQLDLLKQLNCHYAQGYFIDRPLSKSDFQNCIKQLSKPAAEVGI